MQLLVYEDALITIVDDDGRVIRKVNYENVILVDMKLDDLTLHVCIFDD
jgi:hypothetical protein